MPHDEETSTIDTPTLGHNDEKARQILDGARAVFLRDGFDGASMNDIAKVAGVSKGTLYVYFQSKEALFEALVRHDRRQQAEQMCRWQGENGDVRTILTEVGRSLMRMMNRPDHIAQVRTVIAVAPKFPQIGRAFYEAGPVFGLRRFTAYLDRQVAEGHLEIADTRKAALVFIHICQSDVHKRLMFCVDETADPVEIDEAVSDAVDIFMKVYGKV